MYSPGPSVGPIQKLQSYVFRGRLDQGRACRLTAVLGFIQRARAS